MKADNRKPAFCTIAENGCLFTVTYYKDEHGTTSRREGYSLETFDECPAETPVIDFRTGNLKKIINFILDNNGSHETDTDGDPISATQYAQKAAKCTGATLTTVAALKTAKTQAAI